MKSAFDVITVPDFRPAQRMKFEARTLFFLGSWLENTGPARRGLPLHVACIDEPPRSVRELARRCGARVTVHEPLVISAGPFANKFRGLEVTPQEDRFLLLDTDIFVLGDLRPLGRLGRCIAAAPAIKARVPDERWPEVYAALGLPMPNERILPQLGHGLAHRTKPGFDAHRARPMPPYYNGGVVFALWSCGLREVWQSHLTRLYDAFRDDDTPGGPLRECDQVALATAIVKLRGEGMPFRPLPFAYNAHHNLLRVGALRAEEVRCLHAIGFLHDFSEGAQLPALTDAFARRTAQATEKGARIRPAVGFLRRWLRGSRAGAQPTDMRRLIEGIGARYVSPAITE